MTKSKFGVRDRRDLPVFIHSELDDFGLDPYEFRVYARLVRRADGAGTAYESVPNIAHATRMSARKVRYTLKILCAVGLIRLVETREGETNIYEVLDKADWCSRSDVERLRAQALAANPSKAPRHKTPASGAAKGSPLKVLPVKGSPERDLAKTDKAQELVELYNDAKPASWSRCHSLNGKRKRAIAALFKDHGAATLDLFRAALVHVRTSAWWAEKDMSIDTLLVAGRVLEFAEKADTSKALAGLSRADREILQSAHDIYVAIGGHDD